MMRQRHQQILAGLLVVQLILIAVVFWPRPAATGEGRPLLQGFQGTQVVGLTITDRDGNHIVLRKVDGAWVLPDSGAYPVLTSKVDALLAKLAGLTDRRLVTRTAASHKQLQVAADRFVRQLDIEMADGTRYRLYLGSTPSYGVAHLRLDGHDETYAAELSTSDLGMGATAWVDTIYLNVDSSTVTALTVRNATGSLEFTKDDQGNWALAGLSADEVLDSAKVDTLLRQVTTVRLLRPLGKENQPEYGMDNPQAVVTLKTADKEITLTIGAQNPANSAYTVISSESPYYVEVSGSSLRDVVEKGRDGYLVPPPTSTPTPTAAPLPTPTPTPSP